MSCVPASLCTFVWTGIAILGLLAAASPAAAGSITIAWDPSPTPAITHYRIYVGRVPGVYREYYDVGPFQTSFVYQAAVDGVSYYFAVAAAQDFIVGPKSDELLAMSPSLRADVPAGVAVLSSTMASTGAAAVRNCPSQTGCNRAATRDESLASVGAMAALRDGRVLVVEDGRAVRMLGEDGGLSAPVLESSSEDDRITALAVDPMFAATRTVLVGETTTRPDGRRLTVSRYREFGGSLGDRATVVAGLRLPGERDARIAMDAAGLVYIALPAETRGSAVAGGQGSVLRLALDGTVPRDNPGGVPVFAPGPSLPRALLATVNGDVWVVGAEPEARWLVTPQVARAESPAVGLVWQRTGDDAGRETVSAAVSSDTTTGRPRFFTVDADGTLWSQIAGASGSRLDLGISRVVATQVAAGPGGQLYVAVRASGDAAGSRDVSWIVRLFTQ